MEYEKMCADCLYGKQEKRAALLPTEEDRERFLSKVRLMLGSADEHSTAPELVYHFDRLYEECHGTLHYYGPEKKKYNDLMLTMEDTIRERILSSADPLRQALLYSQSGNYIDFGALEQVDERKLLTLLENAGGQKKNGDPLPSYEEFTGALSRAEHFLILLDNCGEIVLDKLFLQELKKRFPQLTIHAMTRGAEVLNDATLEDAHYIGMDKTTSLISSGASAAGTIPQLLSAEALELLQSADVVLSKGQANYESLHGKFDGEINDRIWFSFLCKCGLFTKRFGVPPLTGMFFRESSNWKE